MKKICKPLLHYETFAISHIRTNTLHKNFNNKSMYQGNCVVKITKNSIFI